MCPRRLLSSASLYIVYFPHKYQAKHCICVGTVYQTCQAALLTHCPIVNVSKHTRICCRGLYADSNQFSPLFVLSCKLFWILLLFIESRVTVLSAILRHLRYHIKNRDDLLSKSLDVLGSILTNLHDQEQVSRGLCVVHPVLSWSLCRKWFFCYSILYVMIVKEH